MSQVDQSIYISQEAQEVFTFVTWIITLLHIFCPVHQYFFPEQQILDQQIASLNMCIRIFQFNNELPEDM